jgi:TrmH family RNA methyltransferase
MSAIRSRDNPRVKRWARLVRDAAFRRAERAVLIEGPHLVAEALRSSLEPRALIVSEAGAERTEIRELARRGRTVVLADRVFASLADADSPPGIAAEIELPQPRVDAAKPAVFLEGVQDPSNVGAILRTAAAFGAGEIVLDGACADPWSSKALRVGQGGHFRLGIRIVTDLSDALRRFGGTTVCTVVTGGEALRSAQLGGRLGWIFGAEGRGASPAIVAQAAMRVTIPMAAGSESINVAAAAAICLYEAFARRQ